MLCTVTAELPPRDAQIEDEQKDRDRDREHGEGVASRVSVPARYCGHREPGGRDENQGEPDEARIPVEAHVPRADEEREAENEQDVADDASGQRAADDLGQPLVDRQQRDDQLGRVAEGRVQEPADARAGVVGRVLRRLADQPGERDERKCRQDEQLDVAEIEQVIRGDRDGREAEGAPEDLPRHEARLSRCSAPSSSTGVTRSWSSGSTRSSWIRLSGWASRLWVGTTLRL